MPPFLRPAALIVAIVTAHGFVAAAAAQELPALVEISAPVAALDPALVKARADLLRQRDALHANVVKLNADCGSIDVRNTAKVASCTDRRNSLSLVLQHHITDSGDFNADARIFNGMNALSTKLGWTNDKQAQLIVTLAALGPDGDPATVEQVKKAWQSVLTRGQDQELMTLAAQGSGPGFPGAGQQTVFEDCAVFALANAAGLPYGVVAARATGLIRQGDWHSTEERANPQAVIENKGLLNGEIAMLAVAFGDAKVVPSTQFASTLADNHPVMIGVAPPQGDLGHEVVLTKTFQHDGQIW